MSPEEVEARFRANGDAWDVHAEVRTLLSEVARELVVRVPDGREKSLMLTKLEEAMFWANAGIARHR